VGLQLHPSIENRVVMPFQRLQRQRVGERNAYLPMATGIGDDSLIDEMSQDTQP
jgi:hypothetical protein